MKKLNFIFLLAIIIVVNSYAQQTKNNNVNYQFGKISQAEIQMTTYPLDTAATAVVLGERGNYEISEVGDRLAFFFTSYRRIKLLKKASFSEYGNIKVGIYTKDRQERLIKIRAALVLPDGTRKEFKEKDFFSEKNSDEVDFKKIAIPNLKEGCIIEYEYEIESQSFITLKSWSFQDEIPVAHSEVTLDAPQQMEYVFLLKGEKNIKSNRDNGRIYIEDKVSNKVTFVADSLPSMKPEAYITTMRDYITRIDFQLSRTTFGGKSENKLSTWADLANKLYENESLGRQFTQRSNYKNIWTFVKPLIENVATEEEKIKILYEYFSKQVNWIENDYSIYAEKSLNDAFEKKKANSGELNMMLLACLKELDIKAYPLLVSTRNHGAPITIYPIVRQFNHLLCYIDKAESSYLVDVGNIYRPLGTPRVNSLNEQGWLMIKENPTWISLNPSVSSEVTLATFELNESGTLKGNFSSVYKGYAAVKAREEEDNKQEKVKKNLFAIYPDIQIDSIVTSELNKTTEPFKRKTYCSIANAATIVGDFIYIKPTLKTEFDVSPFKHPQREYAVDLPYGIKDQFVINLTIPNGYIVEELPKPLKISLEDGGIFQYVSSVKDNSIQLMMKISIDRLHFPKEEYTFVKSFFDKIAEKSVEQIVLKKKN